jgi:exopolysaccharide production protein ExoY
MQATQGEETSRLGFFDRTDFIGAAVMALDDSQKSILAAPGVRPVGGQAKRWFDQTAALCALIAFSPLLAGLALLILLVDGRPILIRHNRIGYGGALFPCLKFRSMVVNGPEVLACHLAANPEAQEEWQRSQKLKDDPRVTPLGKVLRQLSVDELPQLLNIVQGHMSFVGPRPIVPAEVEKYGPAINDYLAARPGLTGLWQVSGRSNTTYEYRVQLDCQYVRSWSMRQDIVIIAKTVPAVFRAQGSY